VDLPGGGRLPDLDAAIAILEQVKRVITFIFLFRLLQFCGSEPGSTWMPIDLAVFDPDQYWESGSGSEIGA
jgi:hypothetical protein